MSYIYSQVELILLPFKVSIEEKVKNFFKDRQERNKQTRYIYITIHICGT